MAPHSSSLSKRLEVLPEQIKSSSRFLLWKLVKVPGKPKPRKIPYYSDGAARGGTKDNPIPLDTPEDLGRLTSLEEALRGLETHGADGVGLALVSGEGVGAFDLDDCLTPDGDLDPRHPGFRIVEEAEKKGAYIEISPSLGGLRILGPSSIEEAYSKGGLEYWSKGRFVTLTGSLWANPKGWTDLEEWRKPLKSRNEESPPPPSEDTETLITRREIEELRSALKSFSSDERDIWVRMGHALKNLGSRGFELWDEWSQKSDSYDEADARAKWETFRPTQTSYKAVFAEAQRNGWENPRAGGKSRYEGMDDPDSDEEEVRSLLSEEMDLGDMVLTPTEFVIDGFMPTGVSLIAGAWGAGKSTNLIPVFAGVAHITPRGYDNHLWPTLRRKVLWVTEAPDQARDTLYSLASSKYDGGDMQDITARKAGERPHSDPAPWAEFREWFRVVPARRTSPKKMAKQIQQAVADLSYALPNGFRVQPVVVLDTVSATLDLENESDNSEVGAAMSTLKENLRGVPLVLVGHTPKAVADQSEGLTFRGAGAWEADSVATYFLTFSDEIRMLALKKCRFAPTFTAITFGSEGGRESIDTPWGEPQNKTYVHGVPLTSTVEQVQADRRTLREEERAAQRSERNQEADEARAEVVMELVNEHAVDDQPVALSVLMSMMRLRPGGLGNKTDQKRAVDLLIERGLVQSVPLPSDLRDRLGSKGRAPKLLIPGGVDPEVMFDRFRASGKPLAHLSSEETQD